VQKLLTSLFEQLAGDCAVVLDFLQGATASFQAEVIGKVDIAHATLADALMDAITAAQNLSVFQRDRHIIPMCGERGKAVRGWPEYRRGWPVLHIRSQQNTLYATFQLLLYNAT
jgi:hypothetical protein